MQMTSEIEKSKDRLQPPFDSNQRISIVNALRNRANRHRSTAKWYTIAVFITITIALGGYGYFNVLKLGELKAENEGLSVIYKSANSKLRTTLDEMDAELVARNRAYRAKIDSLTTIYSKNETIKDNLNSSMTRLLSQASAFESFKGIEAALDTIITYRKAATAAMLDKLDSSAFNAATLTDVQLLRDQIERSFDLRRPSGRQGRKFDSLRQILQNLEYADQKTVGVREPFYLRKKTKIRLNTELEESTRKLYRALSDYEASLKNIREASDAIAVISSRKLNNLLAESSYTHSQILSENGSLNSQSSIYRANVGEIVVGSQNALANIRKLEGTIRSLPTPVNPVAYFEPMRRAFDDADIRLDALKAKQQEIQQEIDSMDRQEDASLYSMPEILARYGMIILLLFIIQVLLSYNRYHYRLASFNDSKADVLEIRTGIDDIDTENLLRLFDSSQVSFGRAESSFQKALQLAKEITAAAKKGK